jgi:Lipocalin-like domain
LSRQIFLQREKNMKLTKRQFAAASLFCLLAAGPALADGLKDQLVGVWSAVSNTEEYADGTKTPWGPDVKGSLILEANGQFSLQIGVGGRAKVEGNPAEHPVGKYISYFGTYEVSDADKVLSLKVVMGSFPGWDGTVQKRVIVSVGDQMTFKGAAPIPSAKGPFTPVVVWDRVK